MLTEVIILKDGLTVFHRSYSEVAVENIDVTSGFFQAILAFPYALGETHLESLNMAKSRFHFYIRKGFTFILREEKESTLTNNQIEEIIENLSFKFHHQFPDARGWKGDTRFFQNFRKTCDSIIEDQPTRQGFSIILDIALQPQVLPILDEQQEPVKDLQIQLHKFNERISQLNLKGKQIRSILYLPQTQYIAYVFTCRRDPVTRKPTHLLCLLTEERNWLLLYRLLYVVQQRALDISPLIAYHINKLENEPASTKVKKRQKRVQEIVANWADLSQYLGFLQASLFERLYQAASSGETVTEEDLASQLTSFFSIFDNSIDRIISAMLTHSQIVFHAKKRNLVEKTLGSVLSFYSHPSVTLWSETQSISQIVGTHSSYRKDYDKKTSVIINLNINKVTGGERNDFCRDLFEDLRNLSLKSSLFDTRQTFLAKFAFLTEEIKEALKLLFSDSDKKVQILQKILGDEPKSKTQLFFRMCKEVNPLLAIDIQNNFRLPRKVNIVSTIDDLIKKHWKT